MITKRIRQLEPSPTFELAAKAKKLKAEGVSVVDMALGEPDFITPKNVREAAIKSIHEGFTHYTATQGSELLRNAVAKKLLSENGVSYNKKEVVIGVGSKQLLYNAFQVLCSSGDEVLVSVPTWSTYIEQIKLSSAKPVLLRIEPPFKLESSDLIDKISPRTKIILLNSPSNPTGAVIEKEELEKIAEIAFEKNIYIISDEIYEKLIYEGEHVSIASFSNEIKERTLTIGGFSKAHAMTGWRVGYAAGAEEIIRAMISLQGQTTSNTCSVSQMAALEAVEGSQESVKSMLIEYGKRRDFADCQLSQVEEITYTKPEGAFYFFVNIKNMLGSKYKSSSEWCEHLLEKEAVAVVPGEAFLYPGYFRFSLTNSLENISEAIKRIKRFIRS
jgi:aspartate aminotransferase